VLRRNDGDLAVVHHLRFGLGEVGEIIQGVPQNIINMYYYAFYYS